jgi:hypothetical protein
MAAQLMPYKNNRDNTVIAANTVNEPKAANKKAAIPKNTTELAGVKYRECTSPNQRGSDFSKERA